jgi:hypothetical protein
MRDAEAIEADEPLEPGQPRESEHLDQRRVVDEQAGDRARDVSSSRFERRSETSPPCTQR